MKAPIRARCGVGRGHGRLVSGYSLHSGGRKGCHSIHVLVEIVMRIMCWRRLESLQNYIYVVERTKAEWATIYATLSLIKEMANVINHRVFFDDRFVGRNCSKCIVYIYIYIYI